MPKKLIVCADGTWNTQDGSDDGVPCPTNVEMIARALRNSGEDGDPQVVFYEPGVGTESGFQLRGGALGRGIWRHIQDCYRFLVHNYSVGDQLYIFGFSRGAFNARSLAGLVRNSGILKRGHEDFEKEAMELYRDYDKGTSPDSDRCVAFRTAHSHDPEIEFVGVWDTVGALGIPGMDGSFRILKGLDWQFHDVTLSRKIKCARHALAIHEHRTEFLPTLWELHPDVQGDPNRLKQVWFTGAHSDVGGGYPDHQLSDISLGWMIKEATEAGLVFGMDALPKYDPKFDGKPHDSFGTLFKLIDFFRGKPHGSGRVWNPTDETCEEIHESVEQRYKAKLKGDVWPEPFATELKRRTGI